MRAPIIRLGKPRLALVAKNGRNSKRSLPAPLVPRDVDLRELPYMPVHISKLLSSEFHATVSAEGWRAGFCLWLRSFHEVPAASVPDDDVMLARLADIGRDAAAWAAVKDEALHGWTLCSDGRWYHKLVAEKALEAWIARLCTRHAGASGNAKRWQGGDAALARIEKQLGVAQRALRALEKYDGNFVSDSGHLTALYRVERVLSKSNSSVSELASSLSDQLGDSQGDRLAGRKPKPKPKKKEEGGASASPPSKEPASAKPRRGRTARQNAPWPEGFSLSPEMAAYAAKAGFDGDRLFAKFHNTALAKGFEYKDWPAAFRTFVDREFPPRAAYGGSPDRPRRRPDV
ncbi:DUF1376 domain-containing protein [Beijerinckia sp. L45]|uniref:DUF1376 domain-containing protein n=1 Tax=Beijerinckia sp. L45 TaxID=1641855 RepID=UPI00131A7148|nr:DUF1376 domain-containing protein [Beijerinckia sp. L45]